MVANKRPRYGGFHDLLKPVIPKAPRSLRRRISRDKSTEDGSEICGFELLADAADKLLQEQESESSTSSTDPKEKGQISSPEEVNNDLLEVKVKPTNPDPLLYETPHSKNDSGSDHASIVTKADFKTKANSSLIMEATEDKSGNLCNYDFGKAVDKQSVGLTSVKTLNDCLEPCVNARVPNKSSSSVHLSFCKDPTHRGNVNINIRDDDEKYFRYNNINHSNTRLSAFGSRSRAVYKRMRKMGPSRYWKVARKLKDYENITSKVISFYHKRKRFQADAVCKRKKLFHQSPINSCIKKARNESVSNLVKFSIKSFKVPDLYVEVPETATVGLLKRSVMEAVTAILHGQLHVGVLVEGNRVRDDNRTLQQSGISQNSNLESLGFMLEPSLSEGSSFLVQQETPSCTMQQQLFRDPSIPDTENCVEKNEVCATFEAEGTQEDCKAFVLAPAMDAEALAVVPLSENPTKRYEFSQRRIRRPFSVSEVEALVEAVETLGAGRWRDVKMRAFGDADHRTYVDLKDKWKTLVHTASIAPQQRRGEAVPQDLLDRVLAAHAYWSQHQHAKKHQKTLEAQM
ncbi:telomere repeat-binding protein 3-like isoform X2 [Bidens hawaiensis]|uniref:telomere repeat-binding protein 3-like isoform X2 n=1 Tax=Bidens hawaiensis TaxID=980011 RepID=UPI00404962AA